MYVGNRVREATKRRFMFRCFDCLSVYAVETDAPYQVERCGACDGKLETLGFVRKEFVVSTEHRCPCDERCTGASGPNCDCQCGGENHGTGALVEVEAGVTRVPKTLASGAPAARAAEFRALRDRVRETIRNRYARVLNMKANRVWLSPADFEEYLEADRALAAVDKAARLKVWSLRMKKLRAMLAV